MRPALLAALLVALGCRRPSPPAARAAAPDAPAPVGLNERACLTLRDDLACRRAALAAIDARDDARALRLASLACDRAHLLSCKTLGWLHENGRGTPRDAVRARALYTRACDGGEASACKSLGLLLDTGAGGPVDRTRAAALYTRACDAGELDACNNLANLYLGGDGVPRDIGRAAALYDRVCAATHAPRPCGNAAAMHAMVDAGAAHD